MFEAFFGFKKGPFSQNPDPQQLFESAGWSQVRARLQFLVDHRGVGLVTGEVGSGKSTATRTMLGTLNPNLYKIIYIQWTTGSALDLLRLMVVRFNKAKKQHPILVLDESQLLRHEALEQLPLLLNFEMDSGLYLSLLMVGQPLLRRTLSLQIHDPLRQRVAVHYHLEGLSREELDTYVAHQLKAAGVKQPLFDDTARQALYQVTKGILRKVNKIALTALRLAASRKNNVVDEATMLDATQEAFL